MRSLASILLLGAAACTSPSPAAGSPEYTSVKDRIAHPTRLYIGPGTSTGAITAAHYTSAGWISGTTPLTVSTGEIDGALDANGKLAISQFEVGVDPIDIPETVFGKPAQLQDVMVTLAKPATADVTWQDDDDATLTLTLALDLQWTIEVGTTTTPLATQHLPPITVDVALTGGGDHVDATLSLDAQGELWNWADLLKLTELKLSLSAATVDDAEM